MTHAELELFLSLLSHTSLSEAAAGNALSQPRASQMLQRLEREIGCALFERSHLGLEPTGAGLAFRSFAERMLSARAEGIRAALEASEGVLGPLHVGVSHTVSVFTIPFIMREFHRVYPGVRLKLTRGLPATLLHGMQNETFDVCLCFRPARTAPFVWKTLFSTELVGIYAPAYESRFEPELQSFARLPLVLPSQKCSYRLVLDTELQKLGVKPNIVMEIDDGSSLTSMVRHGTAVSIVPRVMIKQSAQIKVTPLGHPTVSVEAGIVSRTNPSRAAVAFVAMVCSEIAARRNASESRGEGSHDDPTDTENHI